ncbi:MAG: transcription elongation factor GreA [Planctomycetota bacterium]
MPDNVPMTSDGYRNLQAEIEALEKRRPAIKKAIADARARGDLSENADYHAAREELAMLNARLHDLQDKVARAVVVDPSKAPEGRVAFGNTVTLRRLSDGAEMERMLVGAGEADVAAGRILTTSPVGSALIGHEVGDRIIISLPKGDEEFEIVSIR